VVTGCGCRADRRTDDHIVVATRRPADDDAGAVTDREVARSRPAHGGPHVLDSPPGSTAQVANRVSGRSRTVSAASVAGPPGTEDLGARKAPRTEGQERLGREGPFPQPKFLARALGHPRGAQATIRAEALWACEIRSI